MKKEKKADNPAEPIAEVSETLQPDTDGEDTEKKKSRDEKATKQKEPNTSADKASDEIPDPALEVLRDKLLRLHADFDNYRKRVARDHTEMIKRSNEDLVESLLPVLDHIGHGEAMMGNNDDPSATPYLEGFRMVKNELLKVLGDYGVKPIDTAGIVFDANLHEALSVQKSDTAEPGEILIEVRRGYLLNGRVLRASQVIVASDDSGASVCETEKTSATEADGE